MNVLSPNISLRRSVSFFFSIFALLDIYASPFPGISIGELLLFFTFIYCAIKSNGFVFKIPFEFYPFFWLILYGSLITIIVIAFNTWPDQNNMLYDAGSKILFLIILLVGIKYIDVKYLSNYIGKVADIVCAFFFIQLILGYLGIRISGIIPGLPLSNTVDSSDFINRQLESERICSFFSEPAHLCQFLILPICLASYGKYKNKKRFFLYGATLFLSGSANGYALIALIIMGLLLRKCLSIRSRVLRIFSISAISLMLFISVTYITLLFPDITRRFTEISGNVSAYSTNGMSSYVRVLRGYSLYESFPLVGKLFGEGFGCIQSYADSHNTSYFYLTSILPDYVNSIQYVLICTGFIGFILLLRQFYVIYINSLIEYKLSIACLFMMMFSATVLFSYLSIIILVSAYGSHSKNIRHYSML